MEGGGGDTQYECSTIDRRVLKGGVPLHLQKLFILEISNDAKWLAPPSCCEGELFNITNSTDTVTCLPLYLVTLQELQPMHQRS